MRAVIEISILRSLRLFLTTLQDYRMVCQFLQGHIEWATVVMKMTEEKT
jgi:hypothetical protein